jgi:aromatic amino acid aminotransferase I
MGFQPLMEALHRLTVLLHNPKYEFSQIPTGGNTDASTKVFKALLDRDDTLLVEDFEFAPPMSSAKALGAGVKGMHIDTFGIVPEALDEMLENWDVTIRGKKCVSAFHPLTSLVVEN